MSQKKRFQFVIVLSMLLAVLASDSVANDNDFCVDAAPLGVPSLTLGSADQATPDPEVIPRICGRVGRSAHPGVWYTVIGTGNRMTVSTCNPGTTLDTVLNVFCSDCDHLVCVGGQDVPITGAFDPACEVADTCENKTCSSTGENCLANEDCLAATCDNKMCSDTGDPCTESADCPPPLCVGMCSARWGHPECFGPPGEEPQCAGQANWLSTVSWCSRLGQEYKILVHGLYSPGDFELSVSDSGTPCWDAADCSQVEIVDTFLTDNGDNDGWADTNETANMRFRVINHSGIDLTGVEARLSTDDPRIACLANPVVQIGDLAAGETKLTSGGFTFRVADVERASLQEEFSAAVKIALSSNEFAPVHPARCSVDGEPCEQDGECTNDDLCEDRFCEISGEPCYYWSDCEPDDECAGTCSRSGNYCQDNGVEWRVDGRILGCDGPDVCVDESSEIRIDLDLDAVGGAGPTTFYEGFESGEFGEFGAMNLDAGLSTLEDSDDYRCSYHDPDGLHPNDPDWPTCYLGVNPAHADAFFWRIDGGRAFTGMHSLHMGIELDSGEFTTPLSALEAIRTVGPINLASTGAPGLVFKHQINVSDWHVNGRVGSTLDRGVVQVQFASDDGSPVGNWMKIEPYRNVYDAQNLVGFSVCTFDPVDDGSTEDDFSDPTDPARIYGLSSTCFPEFVFGDLGSTVGPFSPENLGSAIDGPGLQGETGVGTWVESKFSLEPFRGRRIRLRFLFTSMEVGTSQTWDEFFSGFPHDEGWWIDDVTISNTLIRPSSLAVDEKDNSALRADEDNDCVGDNVDCDSTDSQVWSLPGEATRLRLSHGGGLGGTTDLTWSQPSDLGGTTVNYTILVTGPTVCLESAVASGTMATDSDTPDPEALHQFLVRATNGCGAGPLGTDSSGSPRSDCP